MMEERHEPRGEKETGRLEAFSDAVFAVAITLLVFSLQVPTLDQPFTSEHLVRMLLQRWPSYLAFFISFATILIMWISHHAMFKLIDKSDTLFLFANGFLLLLVTIVPFRQNVPMLISLSRYGRALFGDLGLSSDASHSSPFLLRVGRCVFSIVLRCPNKFANGAP